MNEEHIESRKATAPDTAIAAGASWPEAASEKVPLPEPAPDIRTKEEPTAMEVFFAWEKIRLFANLVLALNVCFAARVSKPVMSSKDLFAVGMVFLVFNIIFCAGPVAENYLAWLGAARRPFRSVARVGIVLGNILSMWLIIRALE
jgi:hypothetical protein